ncbi:chitin binding peritrophin-A domain-containing protein [Nocardia sp. NPDC060256]|uniref:chitin binding peritrophin-A domain-containing protein n=1 Tax=unclassified Nocardia TaxID=2637762 RepID=UPI00365D7490
MVDFDIRNPSTWKRTDLTIDQWAAERIQGTLLPDPGDLSKYYEVNHGEAEQFDCPAEELFNVDTGMCDYPKNVNLERTYQALVREGLIADQS